MTVEVILMDEQELDLQAEQPHYEPRPRWQVWSARIALVIFLALIAMYYVNIARGGL